MGKITIEFEAQYNVGDVVAFRKDSFIMIGIIEGYCVDQDAGNTFWFNIRTGKGNVYTYTDGGDIGECDIIGKLEGDIAEICRKEIIRS